MSTSVSGNSLGWLQRLKIPHVFPLLVGVIFLCSILTWVVPSGTYEREARQVGPVERNVVLPGTYETLPKEISVSGLARGLIPEEEGDEGAHPVSFLGFLSAVPRGLEQSADIVFFIFIIGGVFAILDRVGLIPALLEELHQRFGNSAPTLTVVLMVVIAIGGSTLGMGEEFIPMVPLFLMLSKRMGYDRIYGLAMVMLAADVGFAAATTNPFTVNIAQSIAELPLNSAKAFRITFLVCCLLVTILYILRYGAKIKKDPSSSIMGDDDFEIGTDSFEQVRLERRHVVLMTTCLAIFAFILYSVQELGWWLNEMAGGFLLMGIAAILICRLPVSDATRAFVKGMEGMVVAALVVGFARGIQVVLEDAQVLDTFIYAAAQLLRDFPDVIAAEGMLLFQSSLNFFIPSGSGQAAVTMPLMAPLADVLGLTRQAAVFAFTCGDGFSNTIIPTSGVLMAMLSLAGIPYEKWLRFILPLFCMLMGLAAIFLAIAVWIEL